eukprot:s167_g4.t1
MCSSCQGRFRLPLVESGVCEVCWTLQRLNRVILTRHPAEESPTLLKLLQRLVGKVEGFIEEFEANKALGRGRIGDLSLGVAAGSRGSVPAGEESAPGLTPASKKSARPDRTTGGASPAREREHPPRREKRRSEPREHSKRRRSKDQEKDRSRRRRRREEDSENKVEERPEKEEEDKAGDEEKETPEDLQKTRKRKAEEESDESTTREDRRSPIRRHGEGRGNQESGAFPVPASPSRSPPGYHRGDHHQPDRRHWENKEKPKKDKGYNHYWRGVEFREKYGYNRGRGGRQNR